MTWALLLSLVAPLAHAQDTPSRSRWLLAIGAHEGTEVQDRLRHATDDAERMTDVLQELGGVGPDRTVLLADPTAQEVREQFVLFAERLGRAKARGERPEVVVYYSGHSDDRGITPWGGLLPWRDLRDLVGALPADVRIVVLDSCASGAFVRAKGGVHVEGFLPNETTSVEGDVFLTSASADESAQESDRLGGSYFTHHLVTGLRGAADANADRRVTLGEAYEYAYRQTVEGTELSWAGAQHPTYAIDVSGRGDVVLTDLAQRTATLTLGEGLAGEVSIRDADGFLVAEVHKEAGHPTSVAVPRGRYSLRLRQTRGAYKARVEVEAGEVADITADMLTPISLEVTRLRGPSPKLWTRTHPVSVHFAPKLGSYGFANDIRTVGFSLDLLGAIHPEMVGFSLAGASWVRGDLDGVALQGVFSVVRGRTRGAQIAAYSQARHLQGVQIGGGGHVVTDTDGAQLAFVTSTLGRLRGAQIGAINVVAGRSPEASSGFQGGGLYSGVRGTMNGAQVGFVNDADDLTGLQMGGVNKARQLRGFQFGVLNIVTDDSAGAETFGLFNAVADGYHAVELGTDALAPVALHVKSGSRHVYTVYRFGWDPMAHDLSGWSMGIGFGGHVRKGLFAFDSDVSLMLDERPAVEGFTQAPPGLFVDWRITLGLQLTEVFGLYAGPSLGLGLTLDDTPFADTLAPDLFVPMGPLDGTDALGGYVGYHAGVRFVF